MTKDTRRGDEQGTNAHKHTRIMYCGESRSRQSARLTRLAKRPIPSNMLDASAATAGEDKDRSARRPTKWNAEKNAMA